MEMSQFGSRQALLDSLAAGKSMPQGMAVPARQRIARSQERSEQEYGLEPAGIQQAEPGGRPGGELGLGRDDAAQRGMEPLDRAGGQEWDVRELRSHGGGVNQELHAEALVELIEGPDPGGGILGSGYPVVPYGPEARPS